MKTSLNNLLKDSQTRSGFEDRVLISLENSSIKRERSRIYSYLVLTLVFFGASVPSIIYLIQDLTRTGFSSYAYLIVTEKTRIFVYMKEFFVSLVESVPVFSLALFLCVLGAFLWSLVQLGRSTGEKGFRIHA
jgi:hypothetical protein